MSRVLRLLLAKSAYEKLHQHYDDYREQGSSPYAAVIAIFFLVLQWVFLCPESQNWQRLRLHQKQFFPHISSKRPRSGDVFRYVVQSVWIVFFNQSLKPKQPKKKRLQVKKILQRTRDSYYAVINGILQHQLIRNTTKTMSLHYRKQSRLIQKLLVFIVISFLILLILLCVTQPFGPMSQLIFLLVLWWVAMSIRKVAGPVPVILLVVLSLLATGRYLWWRYSTTLLWNDASSQFFGLLLIFAETYIAIVLVLGYFQSIWPLTRQPVPLPEDSRKWPTVDVLIPTFNEDLSILKQGVYAALGLDWPKDKLNIYILDDGNRPAFKVFAEDVGVHYITRDTNEHAKAGNINNALSYCSGELIAIFDCDFIATRSFLQLTTGWFLKDNKLAIMQTPHHFFSQDPFERNLNPSSSTPSENALFYGVLQDGNDTWNATFFCGSAGILRRSALDDIGGMATESVTEDAYTSLKLQRLGYNSAYIRIPLAAGLATESLSTHLVQRIRWARGMVQVLRKDNPFFGKGLSFPQRLCYFNAMLYFLSGIPRLIFLLVPMAYLLFHSYIFFAPALMVLLYAFPHLSHGVMANSRIQGKYRHFMWNEIYETVMAWYIAVPTTLTLINPRGGKFNVTAKGGLIKETFADWVTARPYLILVAINLMGLISGIWLLIHGPSSEIITVLLTSFWVVYNLIILGGALGVNVEAKQVRVSPRIDFSMPIVVARADGHLFPGTLKDYSESGVAVMIPDPTLFNRGDKISLILKRGQEEYNFPAVVTRTVGYKMGIHLDNLSHQQQIDFIQCSFARADTWALAESRFSEEQPLKSMSEIFKLSLKGYMSIIEYTPLIVQTTLLAIVDGIRWILSFFPRKVVKINR